MEEKTTRDGKLKDDHIKNGSNEDSLDKTILRYGWLITIAAVFVSIYAALELRILYADGSHCLLYMMETRGFPFMEPSRRCVEFLYGYPVVMAIRLGIDSISALIIYYGLTIYLLPLLLIIICYFVLPSGKKSYFVFPLFHYLAGTASSSFGGMLEGPVAAAYFWMLLYLLLFRFERKVWMVVAIYALPAIYLHEVMVFLAPLLAAVAGWRASQEQQKTDAVGFLILTIWFLLIAAVQIFFVLNPRDLNNRTNFFQGLIYFRWLIVHGHVNVPAFAGLFSMLVLAGIIVIGKYFKRSSMEKVQWALVIGFAVISLSMIAATFISEEFITPVAQFKARNQAAFISLPLALFAILSTMYPSMIHLWKKRQNIWVMNILAVIVLSWHIAATHRYADYLNDFRSILAASNGLISWEQAFEHLPDKRRSNFQNMSWGHTNPTLSFLLSPNGRVTAVIANPDSRDWQPFKPNNPEALPRSRFFDTKSYKEILKKK